ncbi:alkaline phosphatase family protein, partial [Myxococcota bacterium]|nr:alkaline phosphatase family protein [Myxococcota bacterium]
IWDHLANSYYMPPEFKEKKKRVVLSSERKSKAFWNMLSEKGMSSLTVGWMAVWPAEKIKHGIMVAPKELFGDRRQTTIKGSYYKDADQMVHPARYTKKVKSLIVEPKDVTKAEMKRYLDHAPKGNPIHDLTRLERYKYGVRWSHARAASVEKIALGLLDDAKPEILATYFQCPDSLAHRYWIFQESEANIKERLAIHKIDQSLAPELKERYGHVLEQCYRDVDEHVGRILEKARGEDTIVILVSDHGFGRAVNPKLTVWEPYGGDHTDEGVILAAGKGIKKGAIVDSLSILDITPTMLALLGLPVGKDMVGRAGLELFEDGKAPKVTEIETWETKAQTKILYRDGFPPRKGALRPTQAQMPKK